MLKSSSYMALSIASAARVPGHSSPAVPLSPQGSLQTLLEAAGGQGTPR